MNSSEIDVDPFYTMETAMKELHSLAVEYNVRDGISIKRFRQCSTHINEVYEQATAKIDVSYLDDFRKFVAKMRTFIGDFLFYDRGASKDSVTEYEAALAMDENCIEALKGIVTVYLQGEDICPDKALPHAERLAQMEPRYERDLEFIKSSIAKKKKRHP